MRTGFTALSALLLIAVQATAAPKPEPPKNGPKATVLRTTNLYVGPDSTSSKLAEITPGREMVIVEKNGPWLRVFANTDEVHAWLNKDRSSIWQFNTKNWKKLSPLK